MSQVNFFMTAADERDFLDDLFARDDTLVFAGRFFDSRRPQPLPSRTAISRASTTLTLLNSRLMPQPRASRRGSGEFAGLFLFDALQDPVIEFTRVGRSKRRLVSGRLYAKCNSIRDQAARKTATAWYGSIERRLKKNYRPFQKTWWFGPGAWEWSMNGGVCCFGDKHALAASLADLSTANDS